MGIRVSVMASRNRWMDLTSDATSHACTVAMGRSSMASRLLSSLVNYCGSARRIRRGATLIAFASIRTLLQLAQSG